MGTDQTQAELDQQRIAANVRAEMARAGMTLIRLAERLDIPYSVLQRRASGTVPFRVQELVEIGRVLGVYPSIFFNGITLTNTPPTPLTPEEDAI